MAMTRRTKPKPVPKPTQEVEPETKACEEPKMAMIEREVERCNESCVFEAYRDGLCFNHYKINQGFVFNEKQNRYVKKEKKK